MNLLNDTPYHIRINKKDKVSPRTRFKIDKELTRDDIEVWYGGKWKKENDLQIDNDTVSIYKLDLDNTSSSSSKSSLHFATLTSICASALSSPLFTVGRKKM